MQTVEEVKEPVLFGALSVVSVLVQQEMVVVRCGLSCHTCIIVKTMKTIKTITASVSIRSNKR